MTADQFADRLEAKPCGKGWKAKCPAHEDRTASLSVSEGADGRVLLKCFTGCTTEDIVAAMGLSTKDLFNDRAGAQSNNPEPPKKPNAGPITFDWQACVDAFSDSHVEVIAGKRGFSPAFVRELRETQQIGIYSGLVAFPVHNGRTIVGLHYRLRDGSWRYKPDGINAAPMIFGELVPGEPVQLFESTWDGLSLMDKTGERSGILITRGAGNGAFAALIPERCVVVAWKQNDELKNGRRAGDQWLESVCEHAHRSCTIKLPLIPGHDVNDWMRDGATGDDVRNSILKAETVRGPQRPLIEFRSPLQLKNFKAPAGTVLVGDYHIVKGGVVVEGGPPGVGKSRGLLALAVAGATGADNWFGYHVHRKFRTFIVQTENGEFRLSRDFAQLDCEALEDFIRICPPPPYGLCFKRDDFRKELADAIAIFQPDIVGFDPWNAAAREQDSKEYLDTFDALKSVLPAGDDAPALLIVAHTRKPKPDERASGRALLNLLAGSYVLGSVPRTVFVMQAASDDVTDNRVVWTCCKNNDGELGSRSAWERRDGLFVPNDFFDWEAFDHPPKEKRGLQPEMLRELLIKGKEYDKGQIVKIIRDETSRAKSVAYDLVALARKRGVLRYHKLTKIYELV